MAATFSGGVHPHDGKSLSNTSAIQPMPLPKEVVLPVSQHIGAPAKAVVEKGQTVRKGQVVAEAAGFVSAPVHASLSGTVTAVEPRLTPMGKKVLSIVIESDGQDAWAEGCNTKRDVSGLTPDQMRAIIRDAGIVGLGGATFPTHVKLSPPAGKPIDTVILNGVECEPYATCDHRLMLERPQDIVAGLGYLMTILGTKRGFIGIEKNKPDAIKVMREAVKSVAGVSVVELAVKYPQGGEKQLIYAVTKRAVPAGGLPMDIGCVVQNVGTAAAINDAIANSLPLVERVVTVTGHGVAKPVNVLARMGDSFSHLIEVAGGYTEKADKLIMGGPMMGIAQTTDEAPIIKGSSCLLVMTDAETGLGEPLACISCTRCVDVCPMKLIPTTIASSVERGLIAEAREYGVMDCMECGSCSYICPSKRRLVDYIKFGKQQVAAIRAKEQAEQRAREQKAAGATA